MYRELRVLKMKVKDKHQRLMLNIEGLAVAVFSVLAFFYLGGVWWIFVVGFFAIDVSMIGYVWNNKIGAFVYNFFHIYPWSLVLIFLGMFMGELIYTQLGFVWMFHIGLDRAVGYGLKYSKGFNETHLKRL